MPIDPGRLERLDDYLGNVTPSLALRLARAVEIDRLKGGALPHKTILTALRPRLREATQRLDRAATPQRMVCMAFEDLMVDRRQRKQRGRILRDSIEPVWDWLTRTLIPAAAEQALDSLRDKLLQGGADFVGGEVEALQRVAAEAMLNALPSPDMADPRCAEAVRVLGRDVAADAYDMARVMEIAHEVRQLQRLLPRPMHTLTEEETHRIQAVFDRVSATKPDAAIYIPFLVLGRLEKPWEALRLAGVLSHKINDIMISRTEAGAIGEMLLGDLEAAIERLAAIRPADLDADAAVSDVVAFSLISTGIVREIGIKRDGIWGRRLMQLRGGMADQMERLIAKAPRDIAATLPTVRRGGFAFRGARRVPDLTRTLDPQKAARAVQLAKLIAGSRTHGLAGAFAGLLNQVDETVTTALRRYTHDLADEVHALGQDGAASAKKFIDQAVALTAILDGREEAETLRRRAAAALVIAPAGQNVA